MITADTPEWSVPNLKRHHQKHCIKAPDCFKDVLGATFSVTEEEYRNASEEAFQNAYIQYDGSEKERGTAHFYEKCHHRVDGRSLKTTSDLESGQSGCLTSAPMGQI
ncbi:hypothetical protein [Nioella aestuarii]|uniref:hypothetical protein n=1 Tax=Nioella aestuarii TaxID=1662864 RepID=UPI003D7F7836